MSESVSLYEAKTHLSSLVDRVAEGEEIIITKHGVPYAQLAPITRRGKPRKPANAMHIGHIAEDFDAPDPRIESLFENGV